MAAVNSTATVSTTIVKLHNSAFTTPLSRRFLSFSSPSLRRSQFKPLTCSSSGEQTEASPVADVVASAKVFAEETQTTVTKEGEKVKDKVVGDVDDTKTIVIEQGGNIKDKVVEAANSVTEQGGNIKDKVVESANDTNTGVIEQGGNLKDKVVGAADDIKTSAAQQGGNIKDAVVGAAEGMLEATKAGVAEAEGYLNRTNSD